MSRAPCDPGVVLPIKASVNTPDLVTVGLSQMLTPDLTLQVGFEWANWSRLATPAIVGPLGPVSRIALNYEDGYFYSLGLEYRLADRWTLRGGIAYEQSPIDTEIRSTRLPDNDRYWLSLGASYQWEQKLSFDIAYSYVWAKETKIAIVPGHQDFVGLPFLAEADASANVISAALRYRWDDPAVAIPAPIVRKSEGTGSAAPRAPSDLDVPASRGPSASARRRGQGSRTCPGRAGRNAAPGCACAFGARFDPGQPGATRCRDARSPRRASPRGDPVDRPAGPVLVLRLAHRVDHAGDMARAGQHVRRPRRRTVFEPRKTERAGAIWSSRVARLKIGIVTFLRSRRTPPISISPFAELVLEIAVAQVEGVVRRRHPRRIGVPVEEIEREGRTCPSW